MELVLPSRYVLDPDHPVLGEGGMGRVLQARDQVLDVPVALKVVRPDLAADQRFRKLFDLEVRIAARFTHPHIVPLHDLGELGDGTPFLGLALADAGSFANLRHESTSWAEVRRLALELLEALGHLHARGVLHRDLKPENVLLFTGEDGQRHVWLADLGLANAASLLARRKGRVEGTPGFMAPEQHLGLPREYGPWTDLFSLGVILWDLVTGNLPYEAGRSPMEAELPPLIPRPGLEVPKGLDLVLSNVLAAEPLCRYDLAADLRTELLALGEPEVDETRASRERARVRPGGTVAPSVPSPVPPSQGELGVRSPPTGSRLSVAGAVAGERDTYCDDEVAGHDTPVFQAAVASWNRPRPPAMPRVPPPEPGHGASARASLPLLALREPPLVARDTWRQHLWDHARQVARDGQARVVVVVGEAGSGKTRLVESVVRTLQEGGWAEAVSMSWQRPPGKEDGYAGAARSLIRPWNETRATLEARLRRQLARERGALDAAVLEESSMLARWCGLLNEGEEPVAAGYGLREIHRFLEARTWRGLSVLVLEDAQWAAEEGDGLAIAEAALQSAQDGEEKQLLVLVTLRAEELAQDATLGERVDALVAAGAKRLDLPRLDRQGTESLLRESLTLTPSLARRVAERCEGNPLFARQLLLEWANRGWLVATRGLQFKLAPGVDTDAVLPADAEHLFQTRIQALSEASGQPSRFLDVLHMAALAGQVVPRDLLETLAGADLYAFVRGCGLWVDKDALLRFDHGLLHQSVRHQAEQRPDVPVLHRRLSQAYARYGRASGLDVSFDVGRHAHAGGDWATAATHLLAAADRAWRRGRTEELEASARLAVDAATRGAEVSAFEGWARLWRARAFEARGAAQEAGEHYLRARMAFETQEDPVGVEEALVGMGWAARQAGSLDEAARLYAEAMRSARQRGDLRIEATAIAGMAWLEQQKRNFDGADILFTRVLNRCVQLGDVRGAAEAALGQAYVARRKGAFDEAEELYEEAVSGFQQGEDLLGVARAQHGRGIAARQRLRVEEGERLLREASRIAEKLGATHLLMETRVALADVFRLRGDRERAGRFYEAHLSWAERQGIFEAAITARLGLGHIALVDGDRKALYEHARQAAAHLHKVPGHWLWAPYRLLVATLLAMRGDEDETYRWLWSASELGLGDQVDHDVAWCLTFLCHVAHPRGWNGVMRVASKLAVSQWQRLEQSEQAQEVAAMARALLEVP